MISRRTLLAGAATVAATGAAAKTARTVPRPLGSLGLDAAEFGLRPGATEDQSAALRKALAAAASRQAPLLIGPGRYRIADVALPDGVRLIGIPGATRLIAARNAPLLTARGHKAISVKGLDLDGLGIPLAQQTGLIHCDDVERIALDEVTFVEAGTVGLSLRRTGGRVERCRFLRMRDSALFSLDSRGLDIAANEVEDCGNNGIQIWRSQPGDDRSTVRANRVERIRSDAGGDGPNGNGISTFRAGGVIIEGNQLRDCALTFIRNNSGSGVQMLGNQGRRCGEVGLYSEFAFEGAVMANNLIEDCAAGATMTNLDHGGRLSVFANNIVRNAKRGFAPGGKEPIGGFGVHVEAEAAVTGNVIEGASDTGIALGWSWGMRNLVATGNVIRRTGIGISVSLVPKERNALIANNLIADASRGAVVGTEYGKAVTSDLAKGSDPKAAGVLVQNNAVS